VDWKDGLSEIRNTLFEQGKPQDKSTETAVNSKSLKEINIPDTDLKTIEDNRIIDKTYLEDNFASLFERAFQDHKKITAKKPAHNKDNLIKVDFGVVRKYFTDNGFGFVTHTFLDGQQPDVFFHIKIIKKTRYDLVEKLDEEQLDTVYFWYETETNCKGEQVYKILKPDHIRKILNDNILSYIEKIESMWSNADSMIPVWLPEITVDLVGVERANKLSLERNIREKERKDQEEKEHNKKEALLKTEEAKWQRQDEEEKAQEDVEEKEFDQLVAEMKSLGITESKEVSWHIMNNRLGDKYKNISGVVKMEQDGTSWNFKGGFPPDIYARLCRELGLSNQSTRARAVGFKAFKDL